MGYDLRAKNKNVKGISIGAFSWPMFLQETGAGYVLGYGAGLKPATYVYQNGNNGSPVSNDGYKVSSFESKMMAKIFYGFVSVQEFITKQWDDHSEEEKENMKKHDFYNKPWAKERLEQLKTIAKFMDESSGFSII